MYNAVLYTDAHDYSPIRRLIYSLNQSAKTNKQDTKRIKKIYEYIDFLEKYGTRLGEPITEHIEDKIWQLRPGRIRIFLFHWKNNNFVLLHAYEKKTKKTPKREIERAKKEMTDWIDRNGHK